MPNKQTAQEKIFAEHRKRVAKNAADVAAHQAAQKEEKEKKDRADAAQKEDLISFSDDDGTKPSTTKQSTHNSSKVSNANLSGYASSSKQ